MKNLIILYGSDTDGVVCAMLLKLIDEKVDIIMCEIFNVNEIIRDNIENNRFLEYTNIYVTDLGISEETAELIDNNDKLKNIVKLFDHHIGNMHLNDYEWAQVVKNEEKGQACATTIFYRYLINNYDNKILLGENVKELVELTRQIDTWEWAKNNNLDAKKIGDIFIFYGVKIFMEEYFKKLKNPKSKLFEEKENFIFDLEQEHINKYIEKKEKTLIIKQLNNYKVGIVYADIYKAHLGNVLAERYKDSIDFIIIIDLSKGISYRAFKDNIDLNEIAKIYGGGGHAKAAGSPLPESIRDKVFEIIFK